MGPGLRLWSDLVCPSITIFARNVSACSSDVLLDNNPGELWVRFRFVAPKIGSDIGRIGYDVASVDMAHLCQTLAVAYVAQYELSPARVVISFSDRPTEFGRATPDATQFFEAYRLEQSRCIWEGF